MTFSLFYGVRANETFLITSKPVQNCKPHILYISYDCTSLTLNLLETILACLQTEQAQIRKLLWKLPDQGVLCLLMEKWLDMILH